MPSLTRRSLLSSTALASTALAAPQAASQGQAPSTPLRVAVIGLVHGHVEGFFRRVRQGQDVQVVGVAEPDAMVRARYADKHKLAANLLFSDANEMLAKTQPEGVLLYTDTYDHAAMVEACAQRRLPVMMEKPLAVDKSHADRIAAAARTANIPVLVNYETTWYASNHAAHHLAADLKVLGTLRKIVVHDGHAGPQKIGVPPEFLRWLTDPKRNGAGALFDFGCYGANLITWLLAGQRPQRVTAMTQRLQPNFYRAVDDEATILLDYPQTQGIIQASWNWPFSRKDMEVYGETGLVHTVAQNGLRVRLPGQREEQTQQADALPAPTDDFLRYFAAVVRKQHKPDGLSALDNNLIVTEILQAARESAQSGKAVRLS